MASSSTPRPNKASRAKLAKDTINNLIPHILQSNARARAGVESTELIHYSSQNGSPSRKPSTITPDSPPSTTITTPKISIIQSDTLDAAQDINSSLLASASSKSKSRIAVLNMASALQPGGGVLNGSLAQEESLCVRSTLYPSLDHSFYRIPETAALYTSDVLVFRDSEMKDLPKKEWFFVDVVSCAAVKGPDVERDGEGRLLYGSEKDKETMVMKIRLILQVAKEKGVTHLVLGALGCGAYRNPPEEVAKIFKRVLLGDRKREGVEGFNEIVFAIFDEGENLTVFKEAFERVGEVQGKVEEGSEEAGV